MSVRVSENSSRQQGAAFKRNGVIIRIGVVQGSPGSTRMDAVHNSPEEGIECQHRISVRGRGCIGDPLACSGVTPETAPVAHMISKGQTELPCKICPSKKRIVGTVRLHDHPYFSFRIILPKGEIVVQEILLRVLCYLMQRRPGSVLCAALKQGINPGGIDGFGPAVPPADGLPYRAALRCLFGSGNRELQVTDHIFINYQSGGKFAFGTRSKIINPPAWQILTGFTFK